MSSSTLRMVVAHVLVDDTLATCQVAVLGHVGDRVRMWAKPPS